MRTPIIGQTRGGYPLFAFSLPQHSSGVEQRMHEELCATSRHLSCMLEAQASLTSAARSAIGLEPALGVNLARNLRSQQQLKAQQHLSLARDLLDEHEANGGGRRARQSYHRIMAQMLCSAARRLEGSGSPSSAALAKAMHLAADRHAALSLAK